MASPTTSTDWAARNAQYQAQQDAAVKSGALQAGAGYTSNALNPQSALGMQRSTQIAPPGAMQPTPSNQPLPQNQTGYTSSPAIQQQYNTLVQNSRNVPQVIAQTPQDVQTIKNARYGTNPPPAAPLPQPGPAGTTSTTGQGPGAPNTYTGNDQAGATANVSPWLDQNGKFDSTFKPTNDSDYQKAIDFLRNDYTDPYAQQKMAQLTANYNGLSTTSASGINMNPTDAAGMAAKNNAVNQENTSYLDQQIAAAKSKAQATEAGNVSGSQATLGAVNREGVVSAGNELASKTAVGQFQADYNTYSQTLDNQMRQLDEAQKSGNTALADNLSKAVASTQAVMQQHLQTQTATVESMAQAGAFTGMDQTQIAQVGAAFNALPMSAIQAIAKTANTNIQTNQQKAQLDNYSTVLDTASKNFINQGVPLTAQTAQQLSDSVGGKMSAGEFLDLNARAQEIHADKSLDAPTAQAKLDALQAEAKNSLNGVFTNEQKTWQFYDQHQANWTDQQKSDYLMANKMDATANPKTQLENQLQQAIIKKNYGEIASTAAQMNALYPPPDAGPGGGGMPNMGGGNYFADDFKNNPTLQGGNLGCAWVNSSALQKAGILDAPIEGISSEISTLTKETGWTKVDPSAVQPGDIVVYNATPQFSNHQHIGTVVGDNQVMNNRGPSGPGIDAFNQPRGISAVYRSPNPEDAQKIVDAANSVLGGAASTNTPASYKIYGKLSETDFNPNSTMDKDAYRYLQNYFNNDVTTEPTMRTLGYTGAGASQKFQRTADRANTLYQAATGAGLPSMSDLSVSKDLIKGNRTLLNNLNIQEGTVNKNFKLALDTVDKNGIDQNAQPINSWINNVKNLMGDPATAGYLAQNVTLQNELGNLIALKNATGTTVHDKLESAGLIPANATEDQQKEILKKLMQEAENGRSAIQQASGDLYRQTDPLEMNTNNPARQSKTQPAAKPQSNKVVDFIHNLFSKHDVQAAPVGMLDEAATAFAKKYNVPVPTPNPNH